MILQAFALQDMKAGMFSTPFFFHAPGQAIRMCMDMMQDQQMLPARHPNDFQLWQLGDWDDQSGQFSNNMVCLGTLAQFAPQLPEG